MKLCRRLRLRPASLHTKLMVAIAVLVAVVTAGSVTFLIERERGQLLRELEGRATRMAVLLEQSLAQELWNADNGAIQRQLDVLAADPELAEVTVIAAGYGMVATVGPRNVSDAAGGIVRIRRIAYAQFQGFPRQTIGEVRVVLTRAEAEAAIARARRAILAIAAAVVVILYAATSVLLKRMLQTPITRLEAMVDRLAAGDLDARCHVDSADELGRLAERINVMADGLRGSTARLRESETRFRTFVDHATDAFFLHDDQLTVVDVNRQACESLGYSRDELIGMQPRDFDVGLDEASVAGLAERVGAGETVTFESLHRRQDGTVFPVEIRACRFQQGERLFRLSLVRDITDRKRAEAALRDSEHRLEEAQRIAHVGYWDRDLVTGRITLSEEGARIFGLQPEERVVDLTVWHERWQNLIHPEDRPRAAAAAAAALAGGPRYDVEYRVVHRTGEVRMVHSQGDVIRDESGRPCRIFGIMQDITERKRAEAELRKSEERFRTLVQFSFDVYWETDAQHRFTRQEFAEGLADAPTPGSEIGKTRWEVPYLEPDEEAWRQHRATLDAHLPFRDFELARPTPDGSKRYVSVSGLPVFDSTGRFLGYRGVGRHITERKRVDAELRARQELLDLAQKAARAVAFDWHVGGRATENRWSPELEAMYGLAPGTFDGTYQGWRKLLHPDDWPAVKAAINRARESGDVAAEYRVIHKDGAVHWLRAKGRMFFDAKGRPERMVGFMIDVTDWRDAEEALRASEARFRTFVDRATDAFFLLDEQLNVVDVNRQACESLGYTREEMVGRHPRDFDAGLDEPAIARLAERAGAGEGITFETRHRRKDGTVFPVEIRTGSFQQGGRRFYLALARDISERKRAEQILRQSEAYLTEAQRLSHTGSWALDVASDEYVYFSEEWRRIYGFDAQERLLNRDAVLRRIAPQDRARVTANVEKSLRERVDTSDELRIMLPDGTVRDVYVIRHPVLNDAGEVVQLVGTSIDITDRKRGEEALRRSEAYLAEGQRLSHTGSWAWNPLSEQCFYWSEEMFRIFDIDPQQGLPTREIFWARIHPEDRESMRELLGKSALEKTEYVHDHRILLPDGTVKHIHAIGHPVLDEAGELAQCIGTCVDVTERKRSEEQRDRLRELEAELAHIHRVSLMGEFAASIAHEVNQPLAGVVTNGSACLRWLAGDVPNLEEAREAARRIVRDGKRAGEVIARVRALTRREVTSTEKLDLNETILEVLALVGDEAKRRSVVIRTQCADGLAPVAGDRVQLQQVVLNLVMNAIEAMSSVEERARELVITTRDVDADRVQVTVEDSGSGLDPSGMEKMFDPFYTTKAGGMGMGLSICRSILQNHGGRLWATAKDGPGTMFHFVLPKYAEEARRAGVQAV